ncbi:MULTISPECIES: metal-dependent hydrolase [unclassified Lebetimonas]|uniref:aminofutalosine deaminase family hydrolase n=1 Tax=unclassified Lebetimonas TaxID=2648158 RepID=UPI000463186A|nr:MULTISPECIES: metal-dependent hydrolase [unclassified Lebetimonas]
MLKLKADYVLTFNEKNEILLNAEVLFEKKIIKVGYNLDETPAVYLGKNSVLMPALINNHTHLEFSSNKTTLKYGDFITWLNSVIQNRENLFTGCNSKCYKDSINEMKKSGICAFGEISSSGNDLKYLTKQPLKVVYFNEIIGSNPAVADILYQDFLARLENSREYENEKFKTGISVHSPYSVHPVLMDKVIDIAKKEEMVMQTHFMESKAERLWLDQAKGEFKLFFEQNFKLSHPLIKPIEFIQKFKDTKTTFIHCVHANEKELEEISNIKGFISHCPISNRLLNTGLLNLENVKNKLIDYSVATDGKSSNYSLNLFKEIRAALLMQVELHPKYLAKDLLKAVTINAAKSLGLNNGSIEPTKDADLISFKLPERVNDIDNLFLQIILHTNEVDYLYINGEEINL